MPTAKKLPSCSWRCQVYSHTEDIVQQDGTIEKRCPRTITGYKRTRKKGLPSIMDILVPLITQEDIQKAINIEAQIHSPKTVGISHGLVSAVLKIYRPNFALNTALPKKIRPEIYVPTENEVKTLLNFVRGSDIELPILLAAFGPMRRGEICALKLSDISGNVVNVCKNMVVTSDRKWIIKAPKSYAGDRYIDYPDFVADK